MKQLLNERLTRMREKYFNTIPAITAERLVLATEAYQKFAGEVAPGIPGENRKVCHGAYDGSADGRRADCRNSYE